jgi:hypothetical protein
MLLHHIRGGKGDDYDKLWFEPLPAYTMMISLFLIFPNGVYIYIGGQ